MPSAAHLTAISVDSLFAVHLRPLALYGSTVSLASAAEVPFETLPFSQVLTLSMVILVARSELSSLSFLTASSMEMTWPLEGEIWLSLAALLSLLFLAAKYCLRYWRAGTEGSGELSVNWDISNAGGPESLPLRLERLD